MKSFFRGRNLIVFLAVFAILDIVLLTVLFKNGKEPQHPGSSQESYPELAEIAERKWPSFDDLKKYFQDLAHAKSGPYAFTVLKDAALPPNTDLHLLGHAVGDILFEQEGSQGIMYCTQDFRNACSHSIVVGLWSEKGEAALSEIADACRKAPGGSGAYTMCFHGLGHGIFAAEGYDMEKLVALCRKTGTPAFGNREYIECVGGAVMEIISGGGHDREIWERQRARYLNPQEPIGLCAGPLMPDEIKAWCYVYLTPYLFEAAGADMGRPGPQDFEKAFSFCEAIPESRRAERESCFGGFGKEFVVLVQDRDIRRIDTIRDDQSKMVYEWCRLAHDVEGTRACIGHALASLYWGGENNPRAAIRFCEFVSDAEDQSVCFGHLVGAVGYYITDQASRREFCNTLPASEQAQCHDALLQ